mmetsp:Transcript_14078/g.59329  ORF Transcript_14078/g.59329 Transcript_14078/m.59329 type:complete len:250 (+) Transcript_14078:298-1047(+)
MSFKASRRSASSPVFFSYGIAPGSSSSSSSPDSSPDPYINAAHASSLSSSPSPSPRKSPRKSSSSRASGAETVSADESGPRPNASTPRFSALFPSRRSLARALNRSSASAKGANVYSGFVATRRNTRLFPSAIDASRSRPPRSRETAISPGTSAAPFSDRKNGVSSLDDPSGSTLSFTQNPYRVSRCSFERAPYATRTGSPETKKRNATTSTTKCSLPPSAYSGETEPEATFFFSSAFDTRHAHSRGFR